MNKKLKAKLIVIALLFLSFFAGMAVSNRALAISFPPGSWLMRLGDFPHNDILLRFLERPTSTNNQVQTIGGQLFGCIEICFSNIPNVFPMYGTYDVSSGHVSLREQIPFFPWNDFETSFDGYLMYGSGASNSLVKIEGYYITSPSGFTGGWQADLNSTG